MPTGSRSLLPAPGLATISPWRKQPPPQETLSARRALAKRSYVQAHGTGTLQNRQTESHIINHIAESFGIQGWPVAAVKSYLGHSLASSSGDQIAASLGVWAEGIIPGILTVDAIADDVSHSNVDFLLQHKDVGKTVYGRGNHKFEGLRWK